MPTYFFGFEWKYLVPLTNRDIMPESGKVAQWDKIVK